jgi:hypothetical protein
VIADAGEAVLSATGVGRGDNVGFALVSMGRSDNGDKPFDSRLPVDTTTEQSEETPTW